MIGFDSRRPVAVSQTDDRSFYVWVTTAPLVYRCKDGTVIDVPVGQDTDLASTPATLRWLVDELTGAAAAIVHDHMWRRMAPQGLISYRRADHILREALLDLGVAPPRAWLMFSGVRWGSLLTRRNGWRSWHRDAPAVLGITVLASPLLVIAALLYLPKSVLAALDYMSTTMRTPRRHR